MKLTETSIPQNYSQALLNNSVTIPLDLEPEYATHIYEIMFTSFAEFLRLVKSNSNKVAIAVEDIQGNLCLAGIVQYHENEDKDMPGNYSYEFTTNKEDLEDAKVYSITDPGFTQVAYSTAFRLHGIRFREQSFIQALFITACKTLLNWLDTNASPTEEKTVAHEGYFEATVAVENGEKVISIVPDGAMKRLIKDDTAIEK